MFVNVNFKELEAELGYKLKYLFQIKNGSRRLSKEARSALKCFYEKKMKEMGEAMLMIDSVEGEGRIFVDYKNKKWRTSSRFYRQPFILDDGDELS